MKCAMYNLLPVRYSNPLLFYEKKIRFAFVVVTQKGRFSLFLFVS